MLKKAILSVALLLALLLTLVASRPAEFSITRTAHIPAPPEKIFALINDFHQWEHWSPWAKLDPSCQNSFDGPPSGVGAKFAWSGNNEVGSGSMQITESLPGERIKLDLIFTKPMPATNLTVFTLKPDANETQVTWTMSGSNGFMGKLFGLIIDCDKMVGGQFEKGLANITTILAQAKN